MIQDFWETRYEDSIGGFQLLVAKDGYAEHWQRVNEDILENPPVEGEQGMWEKVGEFGDGEIRHVWGLVQGSFNFALEAVVEDVDGALWYWEYTGEWKKRARLPEGYQGGGSERGDAEEDGKGLREQSCWEEDQSE